MRRERLALNLLLNLLHRRSLDFDRSVRVSPGHLQESTRHHVKHVTVCVRVADLATLTVGFHVGCQGRGRLEYLEAFQAAMVCSLVEARGQMQLQVMLLVECFSIHLSLAITNW